MTTRARYDPEIHHRRSIRLKGYDYSQHGAYFITVCTYQRDCLFGEILAPGTPRAEMVQNESGRLVQYTWDDLPNHIAGIELGPFVVMPNHIHGLISIDSVGAGSKPAPGPNPAPAISGADIPGAGLERTRTGRLADLSGAGLEPAPTNRSAGLAEIVRQLKTFSARRINQARNTPGAPVWQRNYWEHIVRNEESAEKIAAYILGNPALWQEDDLYTGGIHDPVRIAD